MIRSRRSATSLLSIDDALRPGRWCPPSGHSNASRGGAPELHDGGVSMTAKIRIAISLAALLAASACSSSKPAAKSSPPPTYLPAIDATQFSATVDNPWFPLPVGRTLEYTGSRDGKPAREIV